jgi:hypothetical protein
MHVEVKDLTPAIRKALEGVRYGARDIEVLPAETFTPYSEGGRGQRGFTLVLNLETGESKTVRGSWGGSNMFVQSPVDHSTEALPLPQTGVVIKGTTGHPRTFATIYAHPAAVGRFLPSGDDEVLTDEEQQAIYCFAGIKGGEYRRQELIRRRVSPGTVDSLVERGYLKRNRAGATQITTKGKNARTIRH